MAPMFHYFHCSQDNLFNICFFAVPGGQQIQDFFVQGNAWTQIPSPKSFQLTVQQPKALPVTSWARCCHWGCCLCFQRGLRFHPLWLQRVTIFPLINTTAFWGRPIFQNGVVLLKNHKKSPGKIKDCKMCCCPELTTFQIDLIKTWRWKEHWSKGESDQLFSFTFTPWSLLFLSSPVLSIAIISSINYRFPFSRFVLFSPQKFLLTINTHQPLMPPSVSDLLQAELLPLHILPTLESNPGNKGLEPVVLLFPHSREMPLGVVCKVLFPLTCSLFLWCMNPKFSSAYLHTFSKQETLTTSTTSLTSRLVSRTCRVSLQDEAMSHVSCTQGPTTRIRKDGGFGNSSWAVSNSRCTKLCLGPIWTCCRPKVHQKMS